MLHSSHWGVLERVAWNWKLGFQQVSVNMNMKCLLTSGCDDLRNWCEFSSVITFSMWCPQHEKLFYSLESNHPVPDCETEGEGQPNGLEIHFLMLVSSPINIGEETLEVCRLLDYCNCPVRICKSCSQAWGLFFKSWLRSDWSLKGRCLVLGLVGPLAEICWDSQPVQQCHSAPD